MKALKEAIYSGHTVTIPIEGEGNSEKISEMHRILGKIFGPADGSYFTHCETMIERKGIKYNVVLVEDIDKKRFQIWFDFGSVK